MVSEARKSEMLSGAVLYAAHGWAVFPCVIEGKTPATQHGFKDASTDVDQVRRWWGRDPERNVAIATGEVSGIWVLDFDKKHPTCWDELEALCTSRGHDFDELRDAATIVETASGGEHWYFALRPGSEIKIGAALHGIKGVDWRGTGGYVIAPPSRTAKGAYVWTDFAGQLEAARLAPAWFESIVLEPNADGVASIPVRDLRALKVYEGENRFVAVQKICGSELSDTQQTEEQAWLRVLGWATEHLNPPYATKELRRIFDGMVRVDKGRNPMREIERDQVAALNELLPDGVASAAEIEEARSVNLGDKGRVAADRTEVETNEQEIEAIDDAAEKGAVEASRDEGIGTSEGVVHPTGWCLENKAQHERVLSSLQKLFLAPIRRWVCFAGQPERFEVEILIGGLPQRFCVGTIDDVTSAAKFERRLYLAAGIRLTRHTRRKGWGDALDCLHAIREDLDDEITLRDEGIDILRRTWSRFRGCKPTPFDEVTEKDASDFLAAPFPFIARDKSLVVPWALIKASADEDCYAASSSWIRLRMQAAGGTQRRPRLSVDGQSYRLPRCYVFAKSAEILG